MSDSLTSEPLAPEQAAAIETLRRALAQQRRRVQLTPREKLDRGQALTLAEWERLPQWKKNRTPRPAEPQKAPPPAAPKPVKWYADLPDLPPLQGPPLGQQDWRTWLGAAFVINLDRRPDRMEAFTRGLPADWPFPPVQRVGAIDGSQVPVPSDWRSGRGAFGLYCTYRRIIEQAILENWQKPIMLLEDDCAFVPGFGAMATERMARLPADFDAVWIGGQHRGRKIPFADGLVRAAGIHRTHAWIVHPRFFRTLLRIWQEYWGHVDHAITACCSRFRILAFDPFLAAQFGGRSNISGRTKAVEYFDPRTKAMFEGAEP